MRVCYRVCAIIKTTVSNKVTGQLKVLQHRSNLLNVNALRLRREFFFDQSEVCY